MKVRISSGAARSRRSAHHDLRKQVAHQRRSRGAISCSAPLMTSSSPSSSSSSSSAYAREVARAASPSLAERAKFWHEQAQKIHWATAPPVMPPGGASWHGGDGDGDDANPNANNANNESFDGNGAAAGRSRWFAGGELNHCYNCVDVHCESGQGSEGAAKTALIHDSPAIQGDMVKHISYGELHRRVDLMARVLREHGVAVGDTVLIYMPMVPETVIAMLACARVGAIHSVVFGGFASRELAVRIADCQPKVVFAAALSFEGPFAAGGSGPSGTKVVDYKELLDSALELVAQDPAVVLPRACVVWSREPDLPGLDASRYQRGRDYDWAQEEARVASLPAQPCVSVPAHHPLYTLYTSGTTGQPKGVVRETGGHAVALRYSMEHIYGIGNGDAWWAASDLGWVVGHSYICYAPLLVGATSVVYEGKPVGTPNAGEFWRVAAQHRVKGLFTAPTAIRAIKKADPAGEMYAKHASVLRETDMRLWLAGERADPATVEWARSTLQEGAKNSATASPRVIDHWWMTETGWPITANFCGEQIEHQSVAPGAGGRAVPGFDLAVLDPATGKELPQGEHGILAIRQPTPPGVTVTLWNDHQRFEESYLRKYPGFFDTGDAGFIDEHGSVHVLTRVDDIINTAGHRLSTGTIEQVISEIPEVAEVAVVGVRDDLKGEVPVAIIVLKDNVARDEDGSVDAAVTAHAIDRVRAALGPVYSFKRAEVLPLGVPLPKTRSGKTLRRTLRAILNRDEFVIPPTIEDATIPDKVQAFLFPKTRSRATGSLGPASRDDGSNDWTKEV